MASSVKASDYLITERRRKEDLRDAMVQQTAYFRAAELKSKWEEETDRRVKHGNVMRHLDTLRTIEDKSLKARRERLRDLLDQEKEMHIAELDSRQETTEQMQEKMKKRAATLKAEREAERQRVADERKRLQWRTNCADIRTIQSEVLEKSVWSGREVQLLEKKERAKREALEHERYSRMWEEDRLKKVEREERDAAAKARRNEETTQALGEKVAELREFEKKAQKLKAQQAQLLREQMELQKMEEDRERARRRAEQLKSRRELHYYNKIAIKRKLKEQQESLALDVHILEDMLAKETDETNLAKKRKAQLREETKKYRSYLQAHKQWEQERELLLEGIRKEEEDKIYQRQLDKYELEAKNRAQLMEEVMQTRKEQINAKLREAEEQRQQQLYEQQLMQQEFDAAREREEATRVAQQAERVSYKSMLQDQIREKQQEAAARRRALEKEHQETIEAEMLYNKKLAEEAKRPGDFSRWNI